MPENPDSLAAVLSKSAGGCGTAGAGTANGAGTAASARLSSDEESNDVTSGGMNDAIKTIAAGGCSPHSTVLSTPSPPQQPPQPQQPPHEPLKSASRKKLLLLRPDVNQDDGSGGRDDADDETTGPTTTGSSSCGDPRESADGDADGDADDRTDAIRRGPANATPQLQRCLAAVLKLSASVSSDGGERILGHIANLLAGLITAEEFQRQVYDVVRLPLRPHIVSLLQKQVPIWQAEISTWVRESKQTTTQCVRHQVKCLLDCSETASSAHDVWEIFQAESSPTRKRRASASVVENGAVFESAMDASSTTPKRPHLSLYPVDSDVGRHLPMTSLWVPPKVHGTSRHSSDHSGSSPENNRQTTVHSHRSPTGYVHSTSAAKNAQSHQLPAGSPPLHHFGFSEVPSVSKLNGQPPDEEWVNIHTMLNCILSMVEKTRRALGILQQRSVASHSDKNDNLAPWKRSRLSNGNNNHQEMIHEASELRRQAGELIAQTLKATEDRVSEVKRKAEEAVQDVKRAAMTELQRALAAERTRADRLVAEARRQGAEETLLALGRHSQAKEVCWNCGRRANETCSGCKIARYCSTFCQHKHWEIHHKICGRVSQLILATGAPSIGNVSEPKEAAAINVSSHPLAGIKNSKSPSPVQGSCSN